MFINIATINHYSQNKSANIGLNKIMLQEIPAKLRILAARNSLALQLFTGKIIDKCLEHKNIRTMQWKGTKNTNS